MATPGCSAVSRRVAPRPSRTGHVQVEQDRVGLVFGDQLQRLLPVRGGTDHVDVGQAAEQQDEALAHAALVIGDDDAQRPGRLAERDGRHEVMFSGCGRGSSAVTIHWLSRGPDPVVDGPFDRVDSQVSAGAVQRDLAAALASLSAGERDVLLLIAWADLSYQETVAALRIPVGTVCSRLNRARRKVREALGGQNPTSNQELGR
jgi:RNA polymerase sigma factor (sigma-70 family)